MAELTKSQINRRTNGRPKNDINLVKKGLQSGGQRSSTKEEWRSLGLVNVYSANAWPLRSHVVHNNLHGGVNISKVHDTRWLAQPNHHLEVYTLFFPAYYNVNHATLVVYKYKPCMLHYGCYIVSFHKHRFRIMFKGV